MAIHTYGPAAVDCITRGWITRRRASRAHRLPRAPRRPGPGPASRPSDGCEVITKFPAEDLLVAGRKYWTAGGELNTLRESQSQLNTAAGRGDPKSGTGPKSGTEDPS